MFRRNEIEGLIPGFTASIMNLISQYRQKRDAENQVPFFVNAVEGERARMANKFESLRSDASLAPLADVIDSVEREVNALADSEIARAQASGTVEFDTLTSALRDAQRGLTNAVGKLGKGK